MCKNERPIVVYVSVQFVRHPVWVIEFKQLGAASRAQLLRESASRITQIHALKMPASFRQKSKTLQRELLLAAAAVQLPLPDLTDFSMSGRNFDETSKDRYDQYMQDCAHMFASQSAATA